MEEEAEERRGVGGSTVQFADSADHVVREESSVPSHTSVTPQRSNLSEY